MLRLNNQYFYHEHTVNFSVKQYSEMLIIHLLAYVLLGPLINIYTLIYWKKAPWLMNNLQFSRISYRGFYIQHFGWVFSMMYFYLFFFTDSLVADYTTLCFIIISYIVRSSSIAGKYATYPRNLYRKICETKITNKEILQELMLMGWWEQSSEVIQLELDSTMKRIEIDDSLFRIAFMTEINDGVKDEFSEIMKIHKMYYANNEAVTVYDCKGEGKQIKFYDAKLIFEYIIKEYNKQ